MTVQRIVVGTDGSEGASTALELAAGLAVQLGAGLVVVHAFEPLAHLGKVEPPIDFARLRREMETALRERWCRTLTARGLAFESRVVDADPVTALVDAAAQEEADLLVVGTRGLGGFHGLLLGSVTTKLLQRSRRPVVVVPDPTTPV